MEETYTTRAVILNHQPFREYDSRVEAYSADRGKLELIARGTKKLSSKLAGHLEPLVLSRIMVVRGRQFDYIGGAAAENCFSRLKGDLEKIRAAGRAAKITTTLLKSGIDDKYIFDLLLELLKAYDRAGQAPLDSEALFYFYIFKLIAQLGYRPALERCLICGKTSEAEKVYFDPKQGGVVCPACRAKKSRYSLTISKNSVNLLRFVISHSLEDTAKLKIDNLTKIETKRTISSFTSYNLNLDL